MQGQAVGSAKPLPGISKPQAAAFLPFSQACSGGCATQALKTACRDRGRAVTRSNPGSIGRDDARDDVSCGDLWPQAPIPLSDIVASVEFALSMAPESAVCEINLEQVACG